MDFTRLQNQTISRYGHGHIVVQNAQRGDQEKVNGPNRGPERNLALLNLQRCKYVTVNVDLLNVNCFYVATDSNVDVSFARVALSHRSNYDFIGSRSLPL